MEERDLSGLMETGKLDLSRVRVPDEEAPVLGKLLANAPAVDEVRVESVSEKILIGVVEGAMLNRRIKGVHIVFREHDGEKRSEGELQALEHYVLCAGWLESFTLHKFACFGNFSMAPLSRALKVAGNLRYLDVTGNGIDDDMAEILAEGLKAMHGLDCLNISCNSIGTRGFEAVFGALEATSITSLNAALNGMRAGGFSALAKLLWARPELTTLELSDCYEFIAGDEDYAAFVEFAAAAGNLEKIKMLGVEMFSPRAGWSLGRAMRNLREFDLLDSNIDEECAMGVAHGLRSQPNNALREVNLSRAGGSERGEFALAEALADQRGLECVYFGQDPGLMSHRVTAQLARAVENNRRLERLYVPVGQDDRVLTNDVANSLSLRSVLLWDDEPSLLISMQSR